MSDTSQFGRTVAEAIAFLDQADVVLIATRATLAWPAVYLAIGTTAARLALRGLPAGDALPSELQQGTIRQLVLGSYDAILHAQQPAPRHA
jgi:hypothetical protein